MAARLSRKRAKELGIPVPPGKNKYHARRTRGMWFGQEVTFDSKKEAARAAELQLLQKAGKITGLRRQVKYSLVVRGVLIATYVDDFEYGTFEGLIVEDCKGFRTREYLLKKRLMKALWNIEIQEV